MKQQALNERSAFDLARQLSRREISAEQLVQACLARIELREPEVQAWTCLAPDAALQRARALDRGPVRGLLHGLPIGIKDLFDTADLPTSYGTAIYAGHQPAADAAVVAICRDAGAIVIGKTVTTELANFHPGKTRNPHRLTHTPGGSSSGSAAAVADAMVPLAFGTQTAASIIRPAAFCGVVGYKPSLGRVVRAGVKSLSETLDTVGGFGRTVPDVALLVAAMTGDERLLDLSTDSAPRFALCRTYEWQHADDDTQAAMALAASKLSGAGAPVADITLPELFATLVQAQTRIMAFEMARNLSWERIGHSSALSPVLAALLNEGMTITPEQHEKNLAVGMNGRQLIDACFGNHDVLIAPSTIGEAPSGLDNTGNPLFCRTWTLLGLPCVHVPFATGTTGLPIGLQVIGRIGADRQTLQAAHWMHARLLNNM
jgi:Asp-tRNA(Asn)/Glu-tRNA(Gln) amidotransferase A subunit family amidase